LPAGGRLAAAPDGIADGIVRLLALLVDAVRIAEIT
jgi:hypothetical protein